MSEPTSDAQTTERLRRLKAAKDRAASQRAGNERGVYLLHTGTGKGKTSAAMNLVYRHIAHGQRAAVMQFVKHRARFPSGDRLLLERLAAAGDPVEIAVMGGGFTWETQDPAADARMADAAWQIAAAWLADPTIALVVLDEIHIALHKGMLPLEPVLAAITARPAHQHLCTTGRYAPDDLQELADCVTDFQAVKHHMKVGVPAQRGIEY
jgi:cob(I)alamin adenosyltransferase